MCLYTSLLKQKSISFLENFIPKYICLTFVLKFRREQLCSVMSVFLYSYPSDFFTGNYRVDKEECVKRIVWFSEATTTKNDVYRKM